MNNTDLSAPKTEQIEKEAAPATQKAEEKNAAAVENKELPTVKEEGKKAEAAVESKEIPAVKEEGKKAEAAVENKEPPAVKADEKKTAAATEGETTAPAKAKTEETLSLDGENGKEKKTLPMSAKIALGVGIAVLCLAAGFFLLNGISNHLLSPMEMVNAQSEENGIVAQTLLQAEQGDAQAMMSAGLLYYYGEYAARDCEKAIQWWQKAGEAGEADGYYNIGILYRDGDGVLRDLLQAKAWFEKGAEGGSTSAMVELGIMHLYGRGTAQDGDRALAYLKNAADEGDNRAMYALGILYEQGEVVEKNDSTAVAWFQYAAENGNTEAMNRLASYAYALQDYAWSWEYWGQAAAAQDSTAMYNLGILCEMGYGVEASQEEAISWWTQAAELGHVEAMNRLAGQAYEQADYTTARTWWTQAAELGSGEAMWNLGTLHETGLGVEKNDSIAQQWYERARAAERDD